MPTRLVAVTVDAADHRPLARWWAGALGWRVTEESDEEAAVAPPPGEPGFELWFVPVPDRKRGTNQLHLDLTSAGPGDQERTVARLTASGARPVDVGQPVDAEFVVLADPEGNEFCVVEPREEYADCGPVAAVLLNVADPVVSAEFWTASTGWPVARSTEHFVGLRPTGSGGPYVELQRSPGAGLDPRPKDRVHLDVAPTAADDQAAETARLVSLGARPVDVGQLDPDGNRAPDTTWDVLLSPDDHELCVLSPRD